ncbi:uncharacterized protein C8Q71DRAFT_426264 [Rhodofomes roseus]|uniref:Uncharacterized protein n=1 Tax=Rhodofomes roseus TaxID=34475 RepID=A0ABQ8KSD5_9APHY|nr:uncharacterized protein C8Q71DRAFT_426264 [Rhodofomes roseus]KAH9840849.1 hypothetical protein C8Q71DRAFT_426264 [Rhodofomes roseus]
MVMAVSLLPVVTNVLNLATIYVVPVPPPSNCAILSKASTPVMRKFEIATRVSAMLVDAMVVLATWQVTGGIRSLAKGIDINVPTTRRLLRDGTIYFFILLLVNALVLALYISPVSFADSNMAMLSDVATTILLSRLFLNLREATFGPTDSAFSGTSQTCDCARRFAPAVGPLGISKIANELDDATGRDDEDLIEDLASTSYAVEEGIASGVAHCPAGCTSREHGDPSEVVESHPMALP